MFRSHPVAILMIITLALMTACKTTDSSASSAVPALDKQHRTLAVGQSTRVLLMSNRTTGYEWSINRSASTGMDRIAITDSGYTSTDSPDGVVGAPGREWWLIKGVEPGEAMIHLVYRRPWEKNTPPARQAVFTIVVSR